VAQAFLTGGSGFIGGTLCSRLVADGASVRALARSPVAAAKVAARGAEPWDGHVLDEDRLATGMAGCAIAYHVAGVNTHCPRDPDHLMRVNVGGTEAVIRAAARAGVRRVVMTSSAASVGEPHGTVGREDTAHRGSYLSVYDRSKHEGELAAFAAGARLGVEVVALNPSSVQGPGRASGNGKLIIDYLNGKLPAFVETHLSVVDIEDTAEAHILAAERGRHGARHVLNGATITSGEALELIARLSGVRERVRIVPPAVAMGAATLVEAVYRLRGRTPSLCRGRVRTFLHGHRYDGSLAARELGLVYTPVEETFRRTIEWAVAEGLVERELVLPVE
jgi:dihydroflavonol-4-reductase